MAGRSTSRLGAGGKPTARARQGRLQIAEKRATESAARLRAEGGWVAVGTGHPQVADGQVKMTKCCRSLRGNQGTRKYHSRRYAIERQEAEAGHGSPQVMERVPRPEKKGHGESVEWGWRRGHGGDITSCAGSFPGGVKHMAAESSATPPRSACERNNILGPLGQESG